MRESLRENTEKIVRELSSYNDACSAFVTVASFDGF